MKFLATMVANKKQYFMSCFGSDPFHSVIITGAAGIGDISLVGGTAIGIDSDIETNCEVDHHHNYRSNEEQDKVDDRKDVAAQGIRPTILGCTVLSGIVMV